MTSSVIGWALTVAGRLLGVLAEGLDFVAETSADAAERACGTGLSLYERGAVLRDPIVSEVARHG